MSAHNFYERIAAERKDDEELRQCVRDTVRKMQDQQTSLNKPGVLLGKIQSGKTRAFIGVIALAFDHGFDVAVVLTKGTVSPRPANHQANQRRFRRIYRARRRASVRHHGPPQPHPP